MSENLHDMRNTEDYSEDPSILKQERLPYQSVPEKPLLVCCMPHLLTSFGGPINSKPWRGHIHSDAALATVTLLTLQVG